MHWSAHESFGSSTPTLATPWEGGWIALATDQSTVKVWQAPLGGAWSSGSTTGFGEFEPTSLVSFRGRLFASALNPLNGESTTVLTSGDGHTWTSVHSGTLEGAQVKALVSGAGGVLAFGSASGRASTWLSADAETWTQAFIDATPASAYLLTAAATPTGFVVAGLVGMDIGNPGGFQVDKLSEPATWYSNNGVSWRPGSMLTVEGKGAHIGSLQSAGTVLLAVGTDPSVDPDLAPTLPIMWRSVDGQYWDRLGFLGEDVPEGMLATIDRSFVSIGRGMGGAVSNGRISAWVSRNGAAWEPLGLYGAPVMYVPGSEPLAPILYGLISGESQILVLATDADGERSWTVTLSQGP